MIKENPFFLWKRRCDCESSCWRCSEETVTEPAERSEPHVDRCGSSSLRRRGLFNFKTVSSIITSYISDTDFLLCLCDFTFKAVSMETTPPSPPTPHLGAHLLPLLLLFIPSSWPRSPAAPLRLITSPSERRHPITESVLILWYRGPQSPRPPPDVRLDSLIGCDRSSGCHHNLSVWIHLPVINPVRRRHLPSETRDETKLPSLFNKRWQKKV